MLKQFDLEEFRKFVASKPADEKYDADDFDACALAQFGFRGVLSFKCREFGIPMKVYDTTVGDCDTRFGALSDRLSRLTPTLMGERE